MQKELLLGSIPDDFNPDIHIPISPICFIGREHIYPNWVTLFEKEPFTQKDIIDIHQHMSNEACILAEKLGTKLNEKYQLHHSKHYWKIVFYTYTELIINHFWISEQYVKNILKTYSDQPINICLANEEEWIALPENTIELYHYLYKKPEFNFWAFSYILRKLGIPKQWKITKKSIVYDSDAPEPNPKSFLQKFENWLDNILINHGHYKRKVYGFHPFDDILMAFMLRIKKPKSNPIVYHTPKYSPIDSTLNFMELVELLLPKYYHTKEHFYSVKVQEGKLKISSPTLIWNEDYKVHLANAIEQGTRVLGAQHGGYIYGSGRNIGSYYPEHTLSQFITWGYTQQNQIKSLTPLPSPLLSKVANKHHQQTNNIILVGTMMPFTRIRVMDFGASWKYRKDKEYFLSNIKESLHNSLYYRPYFQEKNVIKDKSYYTSQFDWLKIHQGNLHQDILKCKLLILDYPGTTLNIAMASNTPIICFWHDEMVIFCEEYLPHHQKLKEAKIVFDNPKDALTHLHEIESDVQGWWQSELVQKTRQEWCQEYALTDKNWRKIWYKFIWNY